TGFDKALCAMGYSLFDTAKRVFWILKKSFIDSIVCEFANEFNLIQSLKKAILYVEVEKHGNYRIGLLRLLFSSYVKAFNEFLEKLETVKPVAPSFNFNEAFESLMVR
ncbi:MAG: hypothetical protein QW739_04075, partial [Candidatus Odinarchaeota archaeon]